ncbi:MAG: transposase [Pseudomonadales bacterium]|nr:transposase [Pseudomonadales bacterium]
MSQDYVLNQKCPACGTRKESTLSAIKSQRVFECHCCGLVMSVRSQEQAEPQKQTAEQEDALAV